MLRTRKRRIAYGILIYSLLFFNGLLWPSYLRGMETYAITHGDDVLCYVQGKDTAKDVISEVCTDDLSDNARVMAISSELKIKKEGKREDVISKEEAIENVKSASSVTVASIDTEVKSFTPDTTCQLPTT